MLSASVEEGGLDRGLEALLVEAERARRHGFLASELEREKTGLLRGYEQAWAERDKTDSRAYAGEYAGNFLEDEPIPGIAFEVEVARRYVPGITLAEVNQLAESFLQKNNRVILVAGPETAGSAKPTEAQLLGYLRARGRSRRPALEGSRGRGTSPRRRARTGRDRGAQAARGHRDHRVAARERRSRHPQADRLQERSGDVRGLQPRRPLAGGGEGLGAGDHRGRGHRAGRGGEVRLDRAAEGAGGQGGLRSRRRSASSPKGSPAARRRRTWRLCSSSSICTRPSRARTPRPSTPTASR